MGKLNSTSGPVESGSHSEAYRRRVNALAVIASAAFAGGILFIGLSLGAYWLSLPPLDYMSGFWELFLCFQYTILPLFSLTLVGVVLSARLDWAEPELRRLWQLAIICYAITSLITLGYHLPENLSLKNAVYSAAEVSSVRITWLLLHVPRVLLAFCIPWLALRAIVIHHTGSTAAEARPSGMKGVSR
ncbi:MAG: hypothetical protein AAGM22_00535 [Acidobacteriota bacterium]